MAIIFGTPMSSTHTHTYTYNDMRGEPPVNFTDIDIHQVRNSAFFDREKEGRRNTVLIKATWRGLKKIYYFIRKNS